MCAYIKYPLEPNFIRKVGFTGVYHYSLEPPRRVESNVYPQSCLERQIVEISKKKKSYEIFNFLLMKKYLYIAWTVYFRIERFLTCVAFAVLPLTTPVALDRMLSTCYFLAQWIQLKIFSFPMVFKRYQS